MLVCVVSERMRPWRRIILLLPPLRRGENCLMRHLVAIYVAVGHLLFSFVEGEAEASWRQTQAGTITLPCRPVARDHVHVCAIRGATMTLPDILRFCDAFELRPGLVSTREIVDAYKEVRTMILRLYGGPTSALD